MTGAMAAARVLELANEGHLCEQGFVALVRDCHMLHDDEEIPTERKLDVSKERAGNRGELGTHHPSKVAFGTSLDVGVDGLGGGRPVFCGRSNEMRACAGAETWASTGPRARGGGGDGAARVYGLSAQLVVMTCYAAQLREQQRSPAAAVLFA